VDLLEYINKRKAFASDFEYEHGGEKKELIIVD
jgi:hypothetical protein